MNRDYLFREIKKEEIPQMFSMILQRIEWMDRQGIEQWNKTGYIQAYPQSYYEEEREKGEVFVLADRSTGELVSAAVLKEMDERWTDDRPALYLHNFVSRIAVKNAGSIFLYLLKNTRSKKEKNISGSTRRKIILFLRSIMNLMDLCLSGNAKTGCIKGFCGKRN